MLCNVLFLILGVMAVTLAAPDGGSTQAPFFRSDYNYDERTHAFYKFHDIRRRWSDAVSTCVAEGAFLPTPITKAEADTLVAQLQVSPTPDVVAWIGLHDMFSEGDFQTLDGKSLSGVYLNWGLGEPNDAENNEDCVFMRLDGSYNDANCLVTYPFVCMKDQSTLTSNPSCETYDTGYNRTTEPNRCYKLHTTPRNWNDAFKVCKGEQANLVVINSKEEAETLTRILSLYPLEDIKGSFRKEYIHVGFNDLINHGIYLTIDGTPLEESGYDLWADNQPDNYENKEHCGSMYRDGKLNDGDCSTRAYFICEKVLKNTSAN